MKQHPKSRRRSEEGIALLIAIFVLLLISVVAIALLVSSGTETALGANYRSSSTVYYAALAGLEEARGRLLPKNPNYFTTSYIPPGTSLATALPLGTAIYVINANAQLGETVVPWDSSNLYYDNEYQSEFGAAPSISTPVNSVWDNNATPGPMYKWVRINAVNEQAIYMDVNNNGSWDPQPLFYDPAHVNSSGVPTPSLIVSSSPTAVQALEITAMAYLPNGSKKILQYLVAPIRLNLTFPAALTLYGFSDVFTGPNHTLFQINGQNDSGDSACGGPTMPYPVPAIGVPFQNAAYQNPPDPYNDVNNVINGNSPGTGIPSTKYTSYIGTSNSPSPPATNPSVTDVALPANLQTPQALNALVQTITQNADSVIQGPANQSQLPSAMSASNPMTVVITGDPTQPTQGNFTLTNSFTGYGLLLVTGTLTYTSDSSWNGIILVIGQGVVTNTSNNAGGIFNGAMLVAQTRDTSGNPLSILGPARFMNTGRGNGISYNCTWISNAQAPLTYKVLSFHEIPQ